MGFQRENSFGRYGHRFSEWAALPGTRHLGDWGGTNRDLRSTRAIRRLPPRYGGRIATGDVGNVQLGGVLAHLDLGSQPQEADLASGFRTLCRPLHTVLGGVYGEPMGLGKRTVSNGRGLQEVSRNLDLLGSRLCRVLLCDLSSSSLFASFHRSSRLGLEEVEAQLWVGFRYAD